MASGAAETEQRVLWWCEHLPLVVHVVEILPQTRLRTLALHVPGGQAAQGGHASTAQGRKPERQHGPRGAADGG